MSHRVASNVVTSNQIDHETPFLRIVWVDVSGIRRCRCVPLHTSSKSSAVCRSLVAANSKKKRWVHHVSRLALTCFFLPCYGDEAVAKTAWEEGDVILSPAPGGLSTIELPGSCDWVAMAAIHVNSHCPRAPLRAHPWCPRALLHGAVQRLQETFGVRMRVGFETEFVLLDRDTRQPLESSVYCQTSGFDAAADVLRDITKSLRACGQRVLHLHGESAPGQFEIVTDHGDDVVAQADAFVVRKEVIQSVARRYGLLASFLPKIWETQAGNACHVHFSLYGNNSGGAADDVVHGVLRRPLASFMEGILRNIDGLLLHTVGSPNSWRRVQPGCWAGAYACWGVQNKEAMLRVIDGTANHVEFKAFDGTANPYMGLAGLICAGMAGLATAASASDGALSSLPPPITIDPQHTQSIPRLPTASFEELVKASLGSHVEEKFARAAHEGNMEHQWRESMRYHCDEACDVQFQAFFEDFARVKLAEVERFKAMSFGEEVELLLDRY